MAPLVDERLAVRCAWEGTAGASKSVARLHGVERLRNHAPNPRLVPGGTEMVMTNLPVSYPMAYVTGFPVPHPLGVTTGKKGTRTPGVTASTVVTAYNVDRSPDLARRIGIWLLATHPGCKTQNADYGQIVLPAGRWVRAMTPNKVTGGAPMLTIIQDTALFDPATAIYLTAVSSTTGDNPVPYFDGDTTAPEVLMSLYAAMAEAHPPPR